MIQGDYVQEAERIIMHSFFDEYAEPGSILTAHKLLNLKNSINNPYVRNQLKNAIDNLVEKGYLCYKNKQITLTQKGYDELYKYE